MARPKKQGLDYFSFDVDFFEDPKIAAIAGEFGIKGEIVAVKLLCAIYREGYFVEWNDMLRLRFLRGLPGISSDLLDAIVSRLVRWGFFDKSLFDSAGVLTSQGIQKRFLEVAKRRTSLGKLPYILSFEGENGVSVNNNPAGTGFLHTIIPQSKVKDIISSNESIISSSSTTPTSHAREGEVSNDSEQSDKHIPEQEEKSCAKKEETLSRLPDNAIEYIPVTAVAEYLKGDTIWLEAICMNKHLEIGYAIAKIEEFAKELQNQGEIAKDKRDCKRHFNNWLRKNRELNEPRTTTNTSRRPAADITNDEIDRRCAERVARRLARA